MVILLAAGKMTEPIKLIAQLRRCGVILCQRISGRYCSVDRQQAEKLYDTGKKPTVAKLLEYDAEIKQLKYKIARKL